MFHGFHPYIVGVLWFWGPNEVCKKKYTPDVYQFSPEKWSLEDDPYPFFLGSREYDLWILNSQVSLANNHVFCATMMIDRLL